MSEQIAQEVYSI